MDETHTHTHTHTNTHTNIHPLQTKDTLTSKHKLYRSEHTSHMHARTNCINTTSMHQYSCAGLSISNHCLRSSFFLYNVIQGRIQEFEIGGGGGHNTLLLLFSGPPPASKLAQVPKKLISGGGGGGDFVTFFSGAPSTSRVAQVATGVGIRHLFFFSF